MRTRIILQLATFLLLIFGTSTNGLFFHYPKNALLSFFQSFHEKKQPKPHNVHHYHLHYYPVETKIITKAVKAPLKYDLEKLHSNHLEALGWNEHEYQHVPEPEIYHSSWPESSLTRPSSIWDSDEISASPRRNVEQQQPAEVPKAGIMVRVPIHQNIFVQHAPPKEEKSVSNPLLAFIQGITRLKNNFFGHRDDVNVDNHWNEKNSLEDKIQAYVVYAHPEIDGKL